MPPPAATSGNVLIRQTQVPEGGKHRERRGDPCGRPHTGTCQEDMPRGHVLRALLALRRRRRPCFIQKTTCRETTCRETICQKNLSRNNGSTGGYDDFDRRIFQETGSPAATQGGCRRNTCPLCMSSLHVLFAGDHKGRPYTPTNIRATVPASRHVRASVRGCVKFSNSLISCVILWI